VTAKHQTPEYRRNAKLRRAQVDAAHRRGEPVQCHRCGLSIYPGQPYDIGHITHGYTSSLDELAPEHRHKNSMCIGNRSHGGAIGAAKTNGARRVQTDGKVQTWPV
jgi:hypothetical protein